MASGWWRVAGGRWTVSGRRWWVTSPWLKPRLGPVAKATFGFSRVDPIRWLPPDAADADRGRSPGRDPGRATQWTLWCILGPNGADGRAARVPRDWRSPNFPPSISGEAGECSPMDGAIRSYHVSTDDAEFEYGAPLLLSNRRKKLPQERPYLIVYQRFPLSSRPDDMDEEPMSHQ